MKIQVRGGIAVCELIKARYWQSSREFKREECFPARGGDEGEEMATTNIALLKTLGEGGIDKEEIVLVAKRWLDSVRGDIVSPPWAKDRDRRRWNTLVRVSDEDLERLRVSETYPVDPPISILAKFARNDERWCRIAAATRLGLDRAEKIPVKFTLLYSIEEAQSPGFQAWLRRKQLRFFLESCYKMAGIANDPGLGLAALDQIGRR